MCGPISTMVFGLKCTGVSAGMGTCGLVGPLGVLAAMECGTNMWVGILVCCFVLPGVLSYVFYYGMKKLGWLTDQDLKLSE